MPAKIPRAKAANRKNPRAAKPARAAVRAAPVPTLHVGRPLPAKSVAAAAKAFKNFSPSRFKKGATPSNHVPPGQVKARAAVHALQRKSIAAQVTALAAAPPANLGMSLALPAVPEWSLAKLFPSFNAATNTVNVMEVLGLFRQRMGGTEFYAHGNPTLTRVVQDSQLLSQVQGFINAIKDGVI